MREVQQILKQALATEDPLERARILNEDVLPAVTELRQTIIKQRALSVKEACDFGAGGDGLTYSQVASELVGSKPSIQLMVALAREILSMRVARSNGQV